MARLDTTDRASLPNSAFAYVDSHGQRRLPIHDEAHVRNALARFGQVTFESEEAKDRARTRLLNAAKRFRIVPVGFISGQLRSERQLGQVEGPATAPLPSGFVTMLMTDIEGSTALVHRLGDRYGELLVEVRDVLKVAAQEADGHVVEARADEFFAVFECPGSGLDAAVAVQRDLRGRAWMEDVEVRVRIGMHSGYPTQSAGNYIGMAVHTTARVCGSAHGGQILVTGDTREAAQASKPEGVRFRKMGRYQLRGLPAPVQLFQVAASGLQTTFPPLRAPLTSETATTPATTA